MAVPLTDEMKAAIDANAGMPVAYTDDRTNEEYVLVRADRYELLRAFTESDYEADRDEWQAAGMEVLNRIDWDTNLPWGAVDDPQ